MASKPAPSRPVTAGTVLRLALWFGLITGLGVAVLTAIKKFLLDQVTLITPQVVWIGPVTFVLLALPVAGLLILLARWFPRRIGLRTIVFVLAAGGSLAGLMTWSTELHDAAVAVLAGGIGTQFARFAHRRPDTFFRFVRLTSAAMIGTVILLAAGANAGERIREARAVAALPQAEAGAPNVLLIILDTVRSWNLSLYGYPRPTTPRLQQFAQQAITFDQAMAPTSWTLPSHASMFTGRRVEELSAGWKDPLDRAHPTIAEFLRARGYRTGGVTGNFFYGNSEWGIDRGFLHWKDYDVSVGHALLATFPGLRFVKWLEREGYEERFGFYRINGRRIAPDVRRDLLRWVERDRERPWFAFVNFYDAHDPYVAPDDFLARMREVPRPLGPPARNAAGRLLQHVRPARVVALSRDIDDYDASIAYLDDQVGRMLDEFAARGLLDNTLVIIASDHGEEFMEHGRVYHGESLYMPSLHVPLLLRLPDGAGAGTRVLEPVPIAAIAATIADVVSGSPQTFGDVSLARVARGEQHAPGHITAHLAIRDPEEDEDSVYQAVLHEGMHYIVTNRGREELYAHQDDPFELKNLMATRPERAAALRSLLAQQQPEIARRTN